MTVKEVMRIGVLSDTHMKRENAAFLELPDGLFSGASMILHAGDIGNPGILDIFFDKTVFAVSGNCDGYDVAERFPVSQIISAGSVRIGLVHGWGARGSVMTRARAFFQDVDVIVFGHTHEPVCVEVDGVLMFNPGSFTMNREGPWPGSAGILTVFTDGSVHGEIFPSSQV